MKAGSKQDVNAIGNRNVGKGLDFYSLEREIALGQSSSPRKWTTSANSSTDPVIN